MAPPEYAEIPSPRLVYAGALDGRFGYKAVSATAKCLPHANVILIGPYRNDVVKQLGAGDNIHLLGPRKYHQLPAYFQHADIGLLPLSDHPANDGRSPMKLFEYGASGLPVVATRTAELTRRKLDFLLLADGTDEFVSQVKNLVNNDRTRARIGLSTKDQSSNYSWEAITHRLLYDTFRGVSQSV
jgi:glycosyltransferase involved in cell wall biosynthesis